MTKEEKHLWYDFLKDHPLTFNRQKVIGKYVVDFFCFEARLIIELDGDQHLTDSGIKKDEVRDAYLDSLGFTVKRYSNQMVNKRFGDVCEDIDNYILKIRGNI